MHSLHSATRADSLFCSSRTEETSRPGNCMFWREWQTLLRYRAKIAPGHVLAMQSRLPPAASFLKEQSSQLCLTCCGARVRANSPCSNPHLVPCHAMEELYLPCGRVKAAINYLLHHRVGQLGAAVDYRAPRPLPVDVAVLINLPHDGEGKAGVSWLKGAQLLTQKAWQHGDDTLHQIAAGRKQQAGKFEVTRSGIWLCTPIGGECCTMIRYWLKHALTH